MQLMSGSDGRISEVKDSGTYYGQHIWISGDSISAMNTWWNVFNTHAFAKSITNLAVSGATWRDKANTVLDGNPTESSPSSNTISNQVQKLVNNAGSYPVPDVVIFFAGLNDAYGTPYSADNIDQHYISDGAYIPLEDLDRKNLAAAIRWSVETVRGLYPYAHVILVAPYQTALGMRDYSIVSSIRDVIEASAIRLSTPFVDLLKNSGIYGPFESNGAQGRYLADGIHLNGEGRDLVGLRIFDVVKGLSFPYREIGQKANLLENADFADGATGWSAGTSSTLAASGGVLTQTVGSAFNNSLFLLRQTPVTYITGHKYYFRLSIKSDLIVSDEFKALWFTAVPTNAYTTQFTQKSGDWLTVSVIMAATESFNQFTLFTQFNAATTMPVGHTVQYKEPMLLDLTAIYGAGNEPSTRFLDGKIRFFAGEE
jgi:lysophospholipase L1-like esterase